MYLMDDAAKRGSAAGAAAVAAGQRAAGFSDSFASVATGGAEKPGPGGAEGAQAAEQNLRKQVGIREIFVRRNTEKGHLVIAREGYVVIAQRIYDEAKAQYREAHKGDVSVRFGKFFGVGDLGSGLRSHLKPIAIVLESKQPGGGPLTLAE